MHTRLSGMSCCIHSTSHLNFVTWDSLSRAPYRLELKRLALPWGKKVEETWLCLSNSLVQQRFSICCSGQRPHIPGKKNKRDTGGLQKQQLLENRGRMWPLEPWLSTQKHPSYSWLLYLWTGVLYCSVLLHLQKIAALFTLHSIRRPRVFNSDKETNPYFTSLVCFDWLWLLFELVTEGLCLKLCFWPLIVWCCPSFCADSSKKGYTDFRMELLHFVMEAMLCVLNSHLSYLMFWKHYYTSLLNIQKKRETTDCPKWSELSFNFVYAVWSREKKKNHWLIFFKLDFLYHIIQN